MSSAAAPGRASCCILGCRHTFKRDADDPGDFIYICGAHYRLAEKSFRSLRTQIKRRAKRTGWTDRLVAIDQWIWDRINKQVTERSMGT